MQCRARGCRKCALDRNKLWQCVGNLDARKVLVAVLIANDDGEVQAAIGNVRKGPARIEREGRQHGKDMLLKIGVHGGALFGIER